MLVRYIPALGHFINDVGQGILPSLLPFFMTKFQLSYEQLALIILANTALATFIQPLFGYLADKYPMSYLIPLGISLVGISTTGYLFAESYEQVVLLAILSSFGAAIFHPEAARLVNQLHPEGKGKAMGIFAVGGQGGFALGPILGGLTYFYGPPVLFTYLSMVALMVVLFYGMKTHQKGRHSQKENVSMKMEEKELPPNDWPSFYKLFAITSARSIIFAVLNTFIPIYWIYYLHQDIVAGNFALTLFSIASVIMTLIGGILSDRIGNIQVIRYSYIAMVPLLLLFTMSQSYWLSLLLVMPVSFALGAQYGPIVVLGQTYLCRSIGFASGITLGLGITLGGVIAPLIGKLGDMYGLDTAWLAVNAFSILGLAFSYFLTNDNRHSQSMSTKEVL